MNEGILQSSPAQQMVAAGSNNWFTTTGSLQHHSLLAALPQNPIPHQFTPPQTAPLLWPTSQEPPHSWSQLVLGFSGEENKAENWEQQLLNNSSIASARSGAKQENSASSYSYAAGNLEFMAANSNSNSNSTSCLSPPRSSVSTSNMRNDIFGFSNKSSESSGAAKKLKINPTTSAQSGIKVRKEKLGDRITALHQIVSPFGKTDTASVLLEAIGYIRFLQRQIEALSLPYLDSESAGNMNHHHVKRERSCLFPEDPGQLLNENLKKRKAIPHEECDEGARKDLKSRGLCLVPLSCTIDFGSENGADYWAPSFGGNFQ